MTPATAGPPPRTSVPAFPVDTPASSPETDRPGTDPDTASIPVVAPDTPPGNPPGRPRTPQTPDPFPPPFRWGDPRPPPSPEVTQVVERDAERTQVVPDPPSGGFRSPGAPPPGPAGFRPPSFAPPSSSPPPDRTQIVPGGIAGRQPSAPVPAARTTPPWVERSPERVDRDPSGMQGSEVFLGKRRELASVIGTAAVVLVVVLVLVLSFTLG